ncbi:MAG: PilZ domain-containing protein [Magnetococcales bacterium]|nr:PilZ domain-containing protein [Magnetococcales bacterium]
MIETDENKIIDILARAVVENNPFKVQLDKQVFVYYSRFSTEPTLLEDIQQQKHILIAPLDPPLGNLKIINAKKTTITLFTELHLVEVPVHFISRPDISILQLSFPKELVVDKQQRESIRVPVEPDWGLIVKAIRPSGISFIGRLHDISTGGLCFLSIGSVPSLAEKSKLEVIIQWPNRNKEVRARAIIIKNQIRDGDMYFRAKFLFDSYKDARNLEEMTVSLQRLHIKKREQLFGDL